MEFGFIEYALMAIVAVALPIWGASKYRQLQSRVAANEPNARAGEYRLTIAVQWIITVVVLVAWLAGGRSLHTLGLGFKPGVGLWVFGSLTVAACVAQIVQMAIVVRSDEKLAELREKLGALSALIPHDDREARLWTALSITAGVCEEIIYRGFMITVVAATVGTWPAVGLTAVAFGIAHVYQGTQGMIKTAGVGVVMGVLFVLTGSLWASMLLHVVVDLTSGHMSRRAVLPAADAPPSPAPV
ncbi:MAG: CPBP family intramembrane glutamic endopeptidase [Candidatus Krumholzibacteriia bacterium]